MCSGGVGQANQGAALQGLKSDNSPAQTRYLDLDNDLQTGRKEKSRSRIDFRGKEMCSPS